MKIHYPECESLLQAIGAKHVLPFDYIVRSMEKGGVLQVAGGQGVQPPAAGVHADYTINGGPRRLEQLVGPLKINDVRLRSLSSDELAKAQSGRWCVINVWRNIRDEPLEKTPLAMCDCSSMRDEDMCCLEQRFVDRTGENYIAAHSPRHAWYYYPRLMRNEAVLLKAWDSKAAEDGRVSSRCSFH